MTIHNSDINVDITSDFEESDPDFGKLKSLAESICLRFNTPKANISIAIVDDETTVQVNRDFLEFQNQTDVISFDLSDEQEQFKTFELVINHDEASRQAAKRGHSLEAELALYITHGLLHNLGFDDADPQKAKKMHDMEDEILQQAGYGVVYDS